ncbi:hypothetical protein OV450_6921 [Actinobacteria bacterium OV450]|nr:hypothetical protein OV450_6921 [Actinobacteria bacterium OV450]
MRHRSVPATFRRPPQRDLSQIGVRDGRFGRLFLVLGATEFHKHWSYRAGGPRHRPVHWGVQQGRVWLTTVAFSVPEPRRIEATATDLARADQAELILRTAKPEPGRLAFYKVELLVVLC